MCSLKWRKSTIHAVPLKENSMFIIQLSFLIVLKNKTVTVIRLKQMKLWLCRPFAHASSSRECGKNLSVTLKISLRLYNLGNLVVIPAWNRQLIYLNQPRIRNNNTINSNQRIFDICIEFLRPVWRALTSAAPIMIS